MSWTPTLDKGQNDISQIWRSQSSGPTPDITRWVMTQDWIEIGPDAYRPSFVRALDEGGMVWEGVMSYPTLDTALHALDTALQSGWTTSSTASEA